MSGFVGFWNRNLGSVILITFMAFLSWEIKMIIIMFKGPIQIKSIWLRPPAKTWKMYLRRRLSFNVQQHQNPILVLALQQKHFKRLSVWFLNKENSAGKRREKTKKTKVCQCKWLLRKKNVFFWLSWNIKKLKQFLKSYWKPKQFF